MDFRKIKDDLYLFRLEKYDYRVGFDYYKNLKNFNGSCSAFRKDDIIARNFDWYNDGHATVIVQNRHYKDTYANVGVAHTVGDITVEYLKNFCDGIRDKKVNFGLIPFLTCDCLNEKSFYCSINVVPNGDKGPSIPVGNSGPEICQAMLPRYLGDKAASVDEAIELMENMIIFAVPNNECHLLLCDPNKTAIVEFINGELVVNYENNIITNFYIDGWNGNIKSVALGYSEDEVEATGLTDHAMGLERYNIIFDEYENVSSIEDAMNLLKKIRYSKSYDDSTNPRWYSEFYSNTETFGDLTIYSSANDMHDIMEYAKQHKDWITNHSSVYDIHNKTLAICSNEEYDESFTLGIDERPIYGIINVEYLF